MDDEMTNGGMENGDLDITMGPVLFNWRPERWRDFWFRIADEAPVKRAVIGEVVCSKRAPLFADVLPEVLERLRAAGKEVLIATLAEVMSDVDRRTVAQACELAEDFTIEINDISALPRLEGRPFAVGPFVNVYNERTLAFLARQGARRIALPVEMAGAAIAVMAEAARAHAVALEVFAWGRAPLALSARCYHARAHGRTKDSCQYVCEEDADGMEISTMDGRPFLAVNGIQTLSLGCVDLSGEIGALKDMGVASLRLSPHDVDMVRVANVFADAIAERISAAEASALLEEAGFKAPAINGFFHARPGHVRITAGA